MACPRCAGRARAVRRDAGFRTTCTGCGLARETPGGWSVDDDGVLRVGDEALSLWLRAPCCGHTLWALNPRHLERLTAFVGATLRERRRDPHYGWSNQSMTNRLPDWMLAADNRAEIVRVATALNSAA